MRFLRARRGTAALEAALVMPVVLLLTFAIIDVGIMLFASAEVNYAVSTAIRQIRTGAVQQASIPSTYAGSTSCNDPSFTPSPTQNCLGIDIPAGATASSIFLQLLCANIYDGGTVIDCNKFIYNIQSFANWSDFTGALPQLVYVNGQPQIAAGSGSCAAGANCGVTFAPGTGKQIVVAEVWYRRAFMIPWIGCLFDPTDCSAGKPPALLLSSVSVFEAEPWGGS